MARDETQNSPETVTMVCKPVLMSVEDLRWARYGWTAALKTAQEIGTKAQIRRAQQRVEELDRMIAAWRS